MAKDGEVISSKGKGGTGCAIAFLGAFALIGLVVGYFIAIRPIMGVMGSRDWVETVCVIESIELETHVGSESTTYSIEVEYRYEWEGVTMRGDRYSFFGGPSSAYDWQAAVVDSLPAGSETVCYINPDDPGDSVLNRELNGEVWFGLIPLVFVVFGVGGMVLVWRGKAGETEVKKQISGPTRGGSRGNELRSVVGERGNRSEVDGDDDGPIVLKPEVGRVGKLVGMVFFGLIWNGVVSVFVWQVVTGFMDGDPEWFLTFFMVPFVLVGLGTVCGVVYFALALANPTVRLTVSKGRVRLGEAVDVAWDLFGKTERLTRLRIVLQGRERATYRRGTSTHTDTHVFVELVLVETEDRGEIRSGEGSVMVPADAMHTFEGSNNRIDWRLIIEGEIPRWPDVNQGYALRVDPMEVGGGESESVL